MATKSIKNIRKEFQANGVFYTPPELAKTFLDYVDITPKTVYDPTCGQGNLLNIFGDEVEKYGQELFKDELDKAYENLKNFNGYCGDTLYDDGFKDKKFDCIVANYPFSLKWEQKPNDVRFDVAPVQAPKGKADWAFILHMLYHLNDEGVCVCMGFPGILYRGNAEQKIRQWFIENNYIDKVVHIPGNTFEDTSIATCLLIIKKNKKDTNVTFIDRENNLSKVVTREEIEKEKYNLSISTYIQKEVVKEKIDPLELETQIEYSAIKRLLLEFEITKMMSILEHKPEVWKCFVNDAYNKIGEYKKENGL